MEIFYLTLRQMLIMFTFILIGLILRKIKALPDSSVTTISRLETLVFVPALTISNWMENCTIATLKENYVHVLYGLAIVLCSMFIAHPLSKLFIKNYKESPELNYKRNIYTYSLTFGNFGFIGNFIVLSIWGSKGLFKYQMFTLCFILLAYSWGLSILIPEERKGASALISSLRRMTKPPIVSLMIGLAARPFKCKGIPSPDFLDVLSNASSCYGPVAMLLAGVVIGGYELKSIVFDKKVYIASFLRLIVLPSIIVLILKALGTGEEIVTFALICVGTPLGINTIIYPGAYGGETKVGASMVMVSHALSVITIPLLYLVFVVLM